MTPTSRIVTPPSANAPKTASEARSTVSLSGCFPNLVMWIPRTQMSSAAMRHPFQWFEPEADRLGTLRVDPDDRGCQANLHPNRDVLGVGRDVDHVGPNAGATTVDQRGNVRDRDARRCHRDDGERPHLTGGVHLDVVEANPAAGRAGVPPVEEPGRAAGSRRRGSAWPRSSSDHLRRPIVPEPGPARTPVARRADRRSLPNANPNGFL